MLEDFAAFILTHGRPDNVKTYDTLKRHGYTGKVFLIIDNEDKTASRYYEKYSEKVIMFDKAEIEKRIDTADNFGNRKTILHSRCACFDIAEKLGIKYFIQLDDDYVDFRYKKDSDFENINKKDIKDLDSVFDILLSYYKSIPALSIAISQGGDFLGGKDGNAAKRPQFRKCMNSFLCSINRRFLFRGTMNEDVNTYCSLGSAGNLFLNIPNVALQQAASQKSKGGITDTYLTFGTFVKAFYTVMHNPSSVVVAMMISNHPRIHHSIAWANTVPLIIEEKYKKSHIVCEEPPAGDQGAEPVQRLTAAGQNTGNALELDL